MLEKFAVGLALAPGLGKTLVTLLAISIFKKRGIPHKTLILAKRRIIRKTWPDEIAKWGFDLSYAVVHGTTTKKRRLLEEEHDVYLMTYESLFWLYNLPRSLWGQFDILVMDESSKIKAWNRKRSKLLRRHIWDFDRRYCLTGSLQPNTEMDVFNPTYMLDGGERLGRFITAYRNKWFYPSGFEGHDWKLQDGAAEEIADVISDIWLRFGDEELELPPLSRVERVVNLGEKAREIYYELENEFIAELDAGIIVAPNSGVASGKLRQITGGAIYTGAAVTGERRRLRAYETVDEEKLNELEDLIDELNGYPLLIGYEFDHERRRILERFPDMPAIGGGTSDADADEYLAQWDRGELPYLLGQTDAMAHGLNMQEQPAHVCFFACGWNFENHYQFIRRVWRQGQTHHVIVYYLIARDTVDEDVVASNDRKGARETMLYEAIRKRNRNRKGPKPMAKTQTKPKKKAAAKRKAPAKKKAAPKKKAAAKKAATGAPQRLRIRPDFRVKRGKAPPEGSVFEALYKCVHSTGTTSLEKLAPAFVKRGGVPSDAFKKKFPDGKAQLAYTRATLLRGIKAGHFVAA